MKEIILVTGATGNVGRHVVSDLLSMGMPVRALTRNPDSARLPGGVGVTRGDLLSLPANAMDNVGTVFLVWRNAGAEPASALIEAIAKRARRIVFLSSSAIRDELDRQTNPIAQVHA